MGSGIPSHTTTISFHAKLHPKLQANAKLIETYRFESVSFHIGYRVGNQTAVECTYQAYGILRHMERRATETAGEQGEEKNTARMHSA